MQKHDLPSFMYKFTSSNIHLIVEHNIRLQIERRPADIHADP